MKNKHKVILVKSVIACSGIAMILWCILCFLIACKFFGRYNDIVQNIADIVLGIFAISTLFMMVLMFKIDIQSEKVKSSKYKIKCNSYKELKEQLVEMLLLDGYSQLEIYNGKYYKIEYMIKKMYRRDYIVAMELTQYCLHL